MSKQLEGEILNAIARNQKKLKKDAEAIDTYNLIWDNYPSVLIKNKIPLGAVALLERSALYIKDSDSLSALNSIQKLLNNIQNSTWEIGYANYSFIFTKADEIISACVNSSGFCAPGRSS